MPNLPFFSFTVPTTTSPLSTPLSPANTSEHEGFQAPLSSSNMGEDLGNSQNGAGFWQQLQIASESMTLPHGQEFSALVAPYTEQGSLESITLSTISTQEGELAGLEENIIELDGIQLSAESFLDTSKQNLNVSMIESLESNQGLDYFNSMRTAAPHYQIINPEVSSTHAAATSALSSLHANMETDISQSSKQSKFEQLGLQTTLTTDASMQAVQASTQPKAMNTAQGSKGFSLSELTLLQEQGQSIDTEALEGLNDKSLHEKPLTLVTTKEYSSSSAIQSQQPLAESASLTDAKLTQMDTSQALFRDSQTNPKSLALETSLSNPTASADKAASHFNKLDVPPNHPQFNEHVAKRVMIMANENMQSARIQLDPPELGALEVKIKVQHDQVSVQFGSNNQIVRDALEAQSPRLKELMEQQGVNLTDVDVTDHSNQQEGQQGDGTPSEGDATDMLATDESTLSDAKINVEGDSLIDYFA